MSLQSAELPREGRWRAARDWVGERRQVQMLMIAVPAVGWVAWWLAGPYLMLFLQSFWSVGLLNVVHDWGLRNYRTIWNEGFYLHTLLKSIRIGLTVAALSTILAFPLAYLIAFKVKRHKMLAYTLVVVPLWASYLVRAYAWKIILGTDGILNTFLRDLGLTSHPINALLYSQTAVIITLTHIFTPFMVLTIFTTLERIPPSLLEASKDLGVGRVRTFFRVVFPLALPGVIAGGLFTVGLASGDFIAPLLVGGPNGIMIANLIQSQFGATYNWPLGSAIAFVMLAFVGVLVFLTTFVEKREEL
jgi:spermidine/putrescine transport system permease protein